MCNLCLTGYVACIYMVYVEYLFRINVNNIFLINSETQVPCYIFRVIGPCCLQKSITFLM